MKASLLISLLFSISLNAQVLTGQLIDQSDSLPVEFASVVCIDSDQNNLSGTVTNQDGVFFIDVTKKAEALRIYKPSELAELHITGIKHGFDDTLDIGQLPIFEAPTYLKVSYVNISAKKVKRLRKQSIKKFNRKIKRCGDKTVLINNKPVKFKAKPVERYGSERLKLVYEVNMNSIVSSKRK